MPPPRPTATGSSLLRGYVCLSCRAKLQQLSSPPWRARSASSTQRVNPNRKSKKPGKAAIQTAGEQVVIRNYEQGLNGERHLLSGEVGNEFDDDVRKNLDSTLKALQDDLTALKSQLRSDNDPVRMQLRSVTEMAFKLGADKSILLGLNSTEDLQLSINPNLRADLALPKTKKASTYEIPRQQYPIEGYPHILHLNAAMATVVAKAESSKESKELWKCYSMCRKTLSAAWQAIPSDAWNILWSSFSRLSNDNPDRMSHVRQLGEDMMSANLMMNSSQSLLYMEATYLGGNRGEAIQQWETARPALTLAETTAIQYWGMGLAMLANDGQPARAQEAARMYFIQKGNKDPRVLLPLIRGWLLSKDTFAVQRAWAIYVRMKYRMASRMEMKDYDNVAAMFLDAGEAGLALGVFKDMMLTGDATYSNSHDSVGLYRRTLKGVDDLSGFDLSSTELSWTSHEPLAELPRQHRNKFFYGSWIKKLIGEGQVDSATLVADLMRQNGLRPDARYINGIIGALFRSGSSKNSAKAEDMAWKMIAARVDAVKARGLYKQLEGVVRLLPTDNKSDSKIAAMNDTTTLATQETFSVLASHYQNVNGKERIQELLAALQASKVHPSTAFLNGLLAMGVSNHRKQWTWTIYRRLVDVDGVVPDCETFEFLWKTMKRHVDPVLNRTKAGFPLCRTLFSEMMAHRTGLAKENFPKALYDRVVLCFGLSDDQLGTAVALRAMQRYLFTAPDEDTVRSVVLQLAKAGMLNAEGYRSRRLNIDSAKKKRILQITQVLKSFKNTRVDELQRQGLDYNKLKDHQVAEETLQLLCKTLMFVAETRREADGSPSEAPAYSIEAAARSAAEEMGVPDCAPPTV